MRTTSAETFPISVRSLCTFDFTMGEKRVRRLHAGKARELFQYPLAHRDRVLSREVLHKALWPEDRGGAGSSSLKVSSNA